MAGSVEGIDLTATGDGALLETLGLIVRADGSMELPVGSEAEADAVEGALRDGLMAMGRRVAGDRVLDVDDGC